MAESGPDCPGDNVPPPEGRLSEVKPNLPPLSPRHRTERPGGFLEFVVKPIGVGLRDVIEVDGPRHTVNFKRHPGLLIGSASPKKPSHTSLHRGSPLDRLPNGVARKRTGGKKDAIQDRALARAVGTNEDRQRRKLVQFALPNSPQAFNLNRPDHGRSPANVIGANASSGHAQAMYHLKPDNGLHPGTLDERLSAYWPTSASGRRQAQSPKPFGCDSCQRWALRTTSLMSVQRAFQPSAA